MDHLRSLIRHREFPLHLGIWLVVLTGYGLFFMRLLPGIRGMVWTWTQVSGLALVFYANLPLVSRYFPRKQYGRYVAIMSLMVSFFTLYRASPTFIFPEIKLQDITLNDLGLPIQTLQLVLFGPLITSIGIALVSTIYQTQRMRQADEARQQALTHQQQEAQLQFLRAQINPHFLFNTLNNIYTLATLKSDRTPKMILMLSELLRYVIYEGQETTISLEKEIRHIHTFIELFQLRSETALQIRFQHPEVPPTVQIEPMLLIPLVENCFKHADLDTNPEAFVDLQLSFVNERLVFQTRNSYDPADQQKDHMGGVELSNIRQRLALRYPEAHELTISAEEAHFDVHLDIPITYHTAAAYHVSSHARPASR